MSDEQDRARQVKRDHEARWLSMDGVVAVGIGYTAAGRVGIVVSVRAETPRLRRQIPAEVDGVPVEIRVSGDIRAL